MSNPFVQTILVLAAAASVFVTTASGQNKIDKFVVSGPAAKAILSKSDISAETAKQLIQACEDFSKAGGYTSSIVVLNPGGTIVASLRMDGQLNFQVDGALYKAQTALVTHLGTGAELMNRYPNQEERLMRQDRQGFWFRPGGLPIIVDDVMIGAIGVSGGRADEMEAYQALVKVIGPQPPIPALATQAAPGGAPAPAGQAPRP